MKRRRSTPSGEHVPVLLNEVLTALRPAAGEVAVDCTLGSGGHSAELLRRVGPTGRLIGFDLDGEHLPQVRERLDAVGFPYSVHQCNFAALASALAGEGLDGADMVLADLGMSSMQVDDSGRGFSYRRDGPLDMRMDRHRGRSAAQLLATLDQAALAAALRDLGDEPQADQIAAAIVAARADRPPQTTAELSQLIAEAVGQTEWRLRPQRGKWELHPAARTFQALRILVNRELANLEQLLRVLPTCLRPGGRAAIISFHSGEDRLVKAAFRDGRRAGVYEAVGDEPVRASSEERLSNPRSRSAKLRWAVRSGR